MTIGDLYIDEDDGTVMVVIGLNTDDEGGCMLYDLAEQKQWYYCTEDQQYLHRVMAGSDICG